jgi:hypothetical protein
MKNRDEVESKSGAFQKREGAFPYGDTGPKRLKHEIDSVSMLNKPREGTTQERTRKEKRAALLLTVLWGKLPGEMTERV